MYFCAYEYVCVLEKPGRLTNLPATNTYTYIQYAQHTYIHDKTVTFGDLSCMYLHMTHSNTGTKQTHIQQCCMYLYIHTNMHTHMIHSNTGTMQAYTYTYMQIHTNNRSINLI